MFKSRMKDAGIYVGFANLPNQVHRKSVKRGFEFTLMVVGESGLGKSTLVDSLFLTSLYAEREIPYAIDRIKKSVSVTTSTVEIEEKGVKLKLTVVDTPGYGDSVNNAASWTPIVNYINEQYEAYLRDESGLNRRNIIDNRVHCCLYFVNPVGHGLKPLDVMVMQALHDKVNIVPVIAKADTLTKKEVSQLKQRILREIQENNIQIYQFPEADEEEDDEEFIAVNKELKTSVPFAVVGSNTVYEVNGRKVRGRIYPWGVVDIENPAHCDFTMLRNMLIRTHMQDLKDVTQDIHYENFRAMKLASGEPPLIREEESSRSNKNSTVDNRDALLLEKEAELKRMQEQIAKLQADMMVKQSNHVDTPSSEVK
ncbi:septin-2-like isoform X3 [Hydractinia symbiolongicarpus]|uniref:septin-2-like isoform X3 n=1 Tax=Hydractinia symbiolongicarpus TaxID=13093 RepID=UPI00254F132C|nr:septin-2-like isoform X3 [Hydractinia symbiolongicarpus]